MGEKQEALRWVRAKIEKESLAPLNRLEEDYIWKSIFYNMCAVSISMDYGVVLEEGEAYDLVKNTVTEERLTQLDVLINHCWYGGVVCDRCGGTGWVDSNDDISECELCEGFGYINDIEEWLSTTPRLKSGGLKKNRR